ncbi:MAG: bifunctional metallophosphatase/5'-nucleotidase [Burkholderiales bacterium]
MSRLAALLWRGLLLIGLSACALPSGVPSGATTGVPTGVSPGVSPGVSTDPLRVRVIAFNDFHGHLEPHGLSLRLTPHVVPAGGAAWLAGMLDRLRAQARHSVTVSAGDLVGASPLVSALNEDRPTIEVMNTLGLDLGVVGNHEFDRGLDHLRRLQAVARFPMIAANVVDAQGAPVFAPSVVREFEGVRVAFVGAVLKGTPEIVRPSGVAGLRFLDEADSIAREVKRLRAQGIEAIVAVIHEGGRIRGDWNDPACPGAQGPIFSIVRRLPPEVDLVLSGHTHQGYHCVIQTPPHQGLRIVQAYADGRAVSVIDLALDRRTGDVDRGATTGRNLPVANGIEATDTVRAAHPPERASPAVQAQVQALVEQARPLTQRVVGQLGESLTRMPSPGGDSALGRWVADAQLAATAAPEQGGARIALMNPGGLRTDLRCQAGAVPCPLRMADAFAAQPFGNSLVVMTLTGEQLMQVLEQQFTGPNAARPRLLQPSAGFGWAWRAQARDGRHVTQAWLNGAPINPRASYRVVVNDFLASGGDGFTGLTAGTDRIGGPLDLDALIEALGRQPQVLAPQPARLQRLPD